MSLELQRGSSSFRSLCAELADQLSAYNGCNDVEEVLQHWNYTNCNELLYRARAALATPPPEPPTDEELQALWHELFSHDDTVSSGDVEVIARVVLERWGQW